MYNILYHIIIYSLLQKQFLLSPGPGGGVVLVFVRFLLVRQKVTCAAEPIRGPGLHYVVQLRWYLGMMTDKHCWETAGLVWAPHRRHLLLISLICHRLAWCHSEVKWLQTMWTQSCPVLLVTPALKLRVVTSLTLPSSTSTSSSVWNLSERARDL